ncbi:MAG: DUF4230 domain-containing protein [Bacteroidota bacterium]
MLKRLLYLLGFIVVFGFGVLLTRYYFTLKIEEKIEENSTVLLEKIKTVAKLITVEGYFSEVYNYKDYWGYDWGIFRKKALMRVKAKVSVGFDLSKMKIEAREEEKLIIISQLPEAEILSIDHDMDYYDLKEGTFNSFTEQDYNKLQENAKKYIEAKARESELFDEAKAQGNQMIDLIAFITEAAGWTIKVEGRPDLDPDPMMD